MLLPAGDDRQSCLSFFLEGLSSLRVESDFPTLSLDGMRKEKIKSSIAFFGIRDQASMTSFNIITLSPILTIAEEREICTSMFRLENRHKILFILDIITSK